MKNFLALLAIAMSVCLVQGESQEDRLAARLLEQLGRTGPIARPLVPGNESQPVAVSLGLALLRVTSLKDSSADMDVWITMSWKDPRISWNPADFGDLSQVALPSDLVWIPDIRPFHAGNYMPDRISAIRVVAWSTSDVIYVLPVRLRAPCDRLRNGSVNCRPVLGSWVYSGNDLNTTMASDRAFSMSEFEPLPGWDVASATAERVENFYPCCPEPYISVKYSLMLNKKRSSKGGKEHDSRRRDGDRDDDNRRRGRNEDDD